MQDVLYLINNSYNVLDSFSCKFNSFKHDATYTGTHEVNANFQVADLDNICMLAWALLACENLRQHANVSLSHSEVS